MNQCGNSKHIRFSESSIEVSSLKTGIILVLIINYFFLLIKIGMPGLIKIGFKGTRLGKKKDVKKSWLE